MHDDPSLRREADMMGFYVALALLVALSTGSDGSSHSRPEVLWIIWGTTVGLALAHWFALSLSVRLVRDPSLHHTPSEMLFSQVVMSFVVALIASAAVLLSPTSVGRFSARLSAAIFIGLLVLVESRFSGSTLGRALGLGFVALGGGVVLAAIKWYLK